MRTEDFHYELPQEQIAQVPLARRDASRLLVLDGESGERSHARFADLGEHLRPGDLLVLNDTRVIPARLFGVKDSGGRAEIMVERLLDNRRVLAQVRASKSPRPGRRILLCADAGSEPETGAPELLMVERHDDLFLLELVEGELDQVLEDRGHVPLPPYIQRPDADGDRERYQTVYAREPGAVAAPTAGLHFTDALIDTLRGAGVETAFVTLHVGAGTFQPVRVADVREHRMHSERLSVSEETAAAVAACRARGGRVVAVGTTVVRALETAAADGELRAWQGETDVFIYPGYRFRALDGLITNFHLPGSTLLMLVSALTGMDTMLAAYREAVAEGYRFFSYGDAMLIWPAREALA